MLSKHNRTTLEVARPVFIGLLIAFAVTMLLIAVFSLVFVIIEKITESAIIPLALISAAAGCFIGALLCSIITKCKGILYGFIIGLSMFVVIWLIGLFGSNSLFGTDTIIKFALLTISGIAGGWVGRSRKFSR